VEWLADNAIPFVLVFTKTDKAKPSVVQANIAAFSERISEWCEKLPEIYTCSAVARRGRRELLDVIEVALAEYEAQTPVAPLDAEPPQASSPGGPGRDARGTQAKSRRPW
jgi:GTPase Era involved in 16S rRNA processing